MKLGYFCYFLLALAAVGSLLLPYSIAMWFLLANVLTWLIYGIDKLAARKAWSRIRNPPCWPSACLADGRARLPGSSVSPQTQKQPFRTYFIISIVLNVVVLVGGYWLYRDYGV